MKVEFDVQLQPKDLYRFNMFQTYTGMSGIISIALGILAFVMAGIAASKPDTETGYLFMYIVMGAVFWFYVPISLWFRAKSTLKSNKVLAGKLHYEVSEEFIKVTQGKESGELPWNMVYKIVSAKKVLAENLKQQAHKLAALKAAAEQKAEAIKNVALTISAKVGATGVTYGSVTAAHVAEELKKLGHDIDRKIIVMRDIKNQIIIKN